MENTWDGNTLDMLSDNADVDTEGRTGVLVNGSMIEATPGDNLPEKVVQIARQSGFGKFNVRLNGNSIDPSEAPSEFRPGDVVEISKYDTAG